MSLPEVLFGIIAIAAGIAIIRFRDSIGKRGDEVHSTIKLGGTPETRKFWTHGTVVVGVIFIIVGIAAISGIVVPNESK